jgi:ComF family protein
MTAGEGHQEFIMSILRHILDFILPSTCSYCHAPVGDSGIPYFCSSCWADFAMLHGPVCPSCGRPFDSPEALLHSPEHRCRECRQAPKMFDQALAIGQFEGPLREAIHQFKYRPCRALGKPLGEWMVDRVRVLIGIDIIIPVPLHTKRLRQRGFNQALLLAHCMSERHGTPLSCDNLVRVRPTRPQVELSGEERIKNVAGAFAVLRPGEVKDKHVILVDDVFTTGATMHECAVVLKEAGAAQVTAFTLARAL